MHPYLAELRSPTLLAMTRPDGILAIDTMIGFKDPSGADRELPQVKKPHRGTAHTADYMYKNVPEPPAPDADVVGETLAAMDRNGVAVGMVPLNHPSSIGAARDHPKRFVLNTHIDGKNVMSDVRQIQADYAEHQIRAVSAFPAGTMPQIAIDDARWYPSYAKCVELGLPIFVNAGVPGPRLPMHAQHVEAIDRVMFDFPELVMVLRHGAEPWEELAVKLMLKWPGLHYSTSAFSPKYYPKAIIDYANTRGSEKIIYGGYYPHALELDRIFAELQDAPFREHAWEPFLRGNAARILGL